MLVIYALYSINTERSDFEENYRKLNHILSWHGYVFVIMLLACIVWPIGVVHDLTVKLKKLVRRIKRGF